MNRKRLKSYLLNEINGLWYDHNKLYTGIIFFDKENNQLDAFEVYDGQITSPYVSPCQIGKKVDSSILIDSSLFCNEEEDIYGCGTVSQFYQGEIYQGMSYTFKNGICEREIYTQEEGYTECQILWNTDTAQILKIEMENLDFIPEQIFYFYDKGEKISFLYSFFYEKQSNQIIGADYHPKTLEIDTIAVKGNILKTKEYTHFHLSMPKLFDFLDNYKYFTFDKFIRFDLDISNTSELFKIWLENNSFLNVEILSIDGENLAGLSDLNIFNNQSIFPHLKEMWLGKETPETQIKRIQAIMPCFKVYF